MRYLFNSIVDNNDYYER